MGDPKDELARLVKQGKDLEAQDRARREDVETHEAIEKSTEGRMRLYASLSPFVRWRWVGLGVLLGALLMLVVIPRTVPEHEEDGGPGVLIAMVAACLPLGALYFARPKLGERAVAREKAWMDSRPFRLVGYFDALSNSSTEGTASLTITFAKPTQTRTAPEDGEGAPFREGGKVTETAMLADDNLAAIFRTVGGKLDTSPDKRMKKISYSVNFGDTSTNNNSHLADFVHGAVALLEKIHAEHPIEDVRVAGF